MAESNESHKKVSVGDLGQGEHRGILLQALANLLSTDIAELTFAQIVDGMPLGQVVIRMPVYQRYTFPRPIYEHIELCDGVLDKARQIRETFDLNILQFDYQVGSRSFFSTRCFTTRLFQTDLFTSLFTAITLHRQVPRPSRLGWSR